MSEFQLILPYKSPRLKAALVSTYALLPVWSLIIPITFGLFIGLLLLNPSAVNPITTVSVCLILLTLGFLGLIWSAISEDNKIHVSKNGISFPPLYAPDLRFNRNMSWSDLRRVDLLQSPQGDLLALTFEPALVISLRVDGIKSTALEEFLLAIELWGTKCERSPVLIDYQKGLQNQNKGLHDNSYTQMWEEELSRRFRSTTFVPLEPGHSLQKNSIKVIRQLAFGGLSAIYLVQKNESEMFVLKEAVIPANADEATRKAAEKHLLRESQMLFCLYHPKIARVLDLFVEDDRHYLLMEYIHGQDLRQYVKQNGAVDPKQVLSWALEIADILQFLHGQEPAVIHRDLTPDNLVLNKDGTLSLIDFGAANEFVGTATGTLVGKQAYIAPEQLRGKAAPQSDLYALGATLSYLLTGRDPIPLMQTDLRTILPAVPETVCDLVKELTAYDRKDRIKNAEELRARLTELVDSLKVEEMAGAPSESET